MLIFPSCAQSRLAESFTLSCQRYFATIPLESGISYLTAASIHYASHGQPRLSRHARREPRGVINSLTDPPASPFAARRPPSDRGLVLCYNIHFEAASRVQSPPLCYFHSERRALSLAKNRIRTQAVIHPRHQNTANVSRKCFRERYLLVALTHYPGVAGARQRAAPDGWASLPVFIRLRQYGSSR